VLCVAVVLRWAHHKLLGGPQLVLTITLLIDQVHRLGQLWFQAYQVRRVVLAFTREKVSPFHYLSEMGSFYRFFVRFLNRFLSVVIRFSTVL